LNSDVEEFRQHVSRWADERLAPRAEQLDRTGDFGRDLFGELGSLGYLGIMYPETAGGSGVAEPYVSFTVLCEELARASMGFAAGICMQGSTATHNTVVATVEPDKGAQALELFLVDTAFAGFSVGRQLDKFAVHSSDTAELALLWQI
jgi:alkylation response protein AidB-like acyl-CoA dehydrogenase